LKLIKDIALRVLQLFTIDYEIIRKTVDYKYFHVIEKGGYFNLNDENSEMYVFGRRYHDIRLCGDLP